ncbi:PepSY domain-containing protein [Virgibacillus ihumii]|uniref:PepSY domain-containing protein n=1 Tax=Virgibacillus ihumii TaxID=2686091 RepID=UPI00157CC434|nr:PepSY domain-containing protein [Virgibacillus ihumii]
MKKKVGFVLSILLGLSALGLGMYHTSASQAAPELSKEQIRDKVKNQYPGKITELEFDKEGKRAVYEVEVVQNGKEYEIIFDGNTGEVLSLEKHSVSKDDDDSDDRSEKDDDSSENDAAKNEKDDADDEKYDKDDRDDDENDRNEKAGNDNRDDDVNAKNNDKKNEANNNKTSKEPRISAAKAQDIALKEVPGTLVSSELDEDDGRLIYEIEVKSDKKEAEFDIDAYTGEIIMMSIDTAEKDDADDRDDDRNDDQDDKDNDRDDGNDQEDGSNNK